MLGMMTLTWAWAENALVLSIGIIDESGAKPRPPQGLPISFSGKLKYLRAALRGVSALKHLQDRGTSLMDELAALADRRNALIHASIGVSESGGLESTLFPKSGGTPARKKVSVAEAVALNIDIDKVSDDVTQFLLSVSKAFHR